MTSKAQEYAAALTAALEETRPDQIDAVLDNLIAIMKARGDLDLYEEVITAYEAHSQEISKEQAVAIVRQQAQTDASIIAEINEALGVQTKAAIQGSDKLIGGIILKVGDEMLDASIKGRLSKIKAGLESIK